MISVIVQGRPAARASAARIRRRASVMLHWLRLSEHELSIVLCDDPTIHALNRTYRHKDKPTDVLAFAMREGEGAALSPNVLGDVIVSLDTAARQAQERGASLEDEVTTLLAHGVLHLIGFDHRDDTEERRMKARQDVLFQAVFRCG